MPDTLQSCTKHALYLLPTCSLLAPNMLPTSKKSPTEINRSDFLVQNRSYLFDHEHRDPGMLDDVVADAAKNKFANAAQSAAANDNQIGSALLGML